MDIRKSGYREITVAMLKLGWRGNNFVIRRNIGGGKLEWRELYLKISFVHSHSYLVLFLRLYDANPRLLDK